MSETKVAAEIRSCIDELRQEQRLWAGRLAALEGILSALGLGGALSDLRDLRDKEGYEVGVLAGIRIVADWLARASKDTALKSEWRSCCGYAAGDLEHYLEEDDPVSCLLPLPPPTAGAAPEEPTP